MIEHLSSLTQYHNNSLQGDQPRTIAIKAVAKANNLDLKIIEEPKTPAHFEVSKLGKVPAFLGEDGLRLFECIAIAIYSTLNFSSPYGQSSLIWH